MAALDTNARADCKSKFILNFFCGLRQTADLDDSEVQTLINDIDTWLDGQTSAANLAITSAIRSKASTNTKFAALAFVASKRAGVI